jgi:uncharacterized protein (TIGR00255 family)
MHSMTGFGAASAPLSEGRVSVEVRALNHKHTDIRLRLPQELVEHSSYFEQAIRSVAGRGRYDISVRIEGEVGGAPEVNDARLKSIYRSLKKLRDEIAPQSELSLSQLVAALPDLLTRTGPDQEAVRSALLRAFEGAHQELQSMRKVEGAALERDLRERLAKIRELAGELSKGAEELVHHHRARLEARVNELLESTGVKLERGRLEQEIALLADRSDITEELVRLTSHFDQFAELLAAREPVGRRLDFLLQEISREVNTVGSKSQHAKVAHLVVEMKSEVERLREQVQNVD